MHRLVVGKCKRDFNRFFVGNVSIALFRAHSSKYLRYKFVPPQTGSVPSYACATVNDERVALGKLSQCPERPF